MKYSFFLKEKKIDNLFFLSISYFIGIKYTRIALKFVQSGKPIQSHAREPLMHYMKG